MGASRRQLALLGAILILLAVVLYRQSTQREPTPEEFSAEMSQRAQPAVGSLGPPAGRAAPREAAPLKIPPVALGGLGRSQPEPSDTGRDPFRFESAPSLGQQGGPSGGRSGAAAPSTAPAGPGLPQEPPGPPPILLKFIGIARQGEGRLYAVLRDDRGVYYGAEGDVIEGRFRILRVSADTVEVSYTDGRGRTSIPLSGGRP